MVTSHVLLVTVEPPWPAHHGGRVRTAGLAESLAEHVDVTVVHPGPPAPAPAGLRTLSWGPAPATSAGARGFASRHPRLGTHHLDGTGGQAVARLVRRERFGAVLYSHSYLRAVAPPLPMPAVTDFPNLEVSRLAGLVRSSSGRHRASALMEAAKARLWEPSAARRSDICLALSTTDAVSLRGWGAQVIEVPNGVAGGQQRTPSPPDGPALYLASGDYAPNRDAGRWLLRHVWPLVLAAHPAARLQVVGRGTLAAFADLQGPGVDLVGEVDDTLPYLRQAGVVLAPVVSGGGRQLKVVNALSAGRTLVVTPYSAASVPSGLDDAVLVGSTPADFAAAVVRSLADVPARHLRECRLVARGGLTTWAAAVAPLVTWIKSAR